MFASLKMEIPVDNALRPEANLIVRPFKTQAPDCLPLIDQSIKIEFHRVEYLVVCHAPTHNFVIALVATSPACENEIEPIFIICVKNKRPDLGKYPIFKAIARHDTRFPLTQETPAPRTSLVGKRRRVKTSAKVNTIPRMEKVGVSNLHI